MEENFGLNHLAMLTTLKNSKLIQKVLIVFVRIE
jgi:hypothetical protein